MQSRFSVGLQHMSRAWRRRVDLAVAALGLSDATAWTLVQIHRSGGGLRQATLADLLGIEGPSLVRLLHQLCADGRVERRDDATDGRAKTLHLTPEGLALAIQVEALLQALREELLAGVSPAELASCLRVFDAVAEAAGIMLPRPAFAEPSV
jgi:MarR family transcriptional regulator for hemolysin